MGPVQAGIDPVQCPFVSVLLVALLEPYKMHYIK